ncbi:DUF397 domain-containing protein [Nocardiopsis sp. NPDC101807]|uniref:DUF397 domain-containing protein n=1 Tax=Nocardiopsis sp. NPDC101807 TaxID=3364339 RepID=UPI00382D48A3
MEKKRGKAKWRRVGGELRALRTGAHLRQKDVAPYAGVVPAQVSAWEDGIRGMSEAQVLALDRVLDANGRPVRAYENAEKPEISRSGTRRYPKSNSGLRSCGSTTEHGLDGHVWHKNSHSSGQGSCVEVAEGERVLVRDTRHRPLGHVEYTVGAWSDFLRCVRSGVSRGLDHRG